SPPTRPPSGCRRSTRPQPSTRHAKSSSHANAPNDSGSTILTVRPPTRPTHAEAQVSDARPPECESAMIRDEDKTQVAVSVWVAYGGNSAIEEASLDLKLKDEE